MWIKDDWRRSGNGLAPIQVFNAVLSPPFSAPRNSHSRFRHQTDVLKNGAPKLPFFSSGRFPHLDQAQTSAAPGLAGYPQGRFEKAKPSTVAAAIPGPSPSFLATQNGREPFSLIREFPVSKGSEFLFLRGRSIKAFGIGRRKPIAAKFDIPLASGKAENLIF